MTRDDLIDLLPTEMKGLSTKLATADYENACDDASRETGWSFPVETDFRILWMKSRAKRHLFFYLLSESAHKFKYEGISLNQRFDHYKSLIEMMDKDYEQAQEEHPEEFMTADSYLWFGTKVDAGFSEDRVGRDTTYFESNIVKSSADE